MIYPNLDPLTSVRLRQTEETELQKVVEQIQGQLRHQKPRLQFFAGEAVSYRTALKRIIARLEAVTLRYFEQKIQPVLDNPRPIAPEDTHLTPIVFRLEAASDITATQALLNRLKLLLVSLVPDKRILALARTFVSQAGIKSVLAFDAKLKGKVPAVQPYRSKALRAVLQQNVTENVKLIKTIPEKYFESVEQTIIRGVQSGVSTSKIAKQIRQKTGVAQTRAAFIARDQVGTVLGQMVQARATQLGLKKFMWLTSDDERVRDFHRPKHKKVYTWEEGAPIDPRAKEGQDSAFPGAAYGCRCIAVPVDSEIEELGN